MSDMPAVVKKWCADTECQKCGHGDGYLLTTKQAIAVITLAGRTADATRPEPEGQER